MTWEYITKIVVAVVSSVGGVGVIIVGLSAWIGKIYQSKIIESQKSLLKIGEKRFETEFGRIFEKRVEILRTLYEELIEIEGVASKSLWFIEAPREPSEIRARAKKFHEATLELGRYFSKSKIFIEEELCDLIKEAISSASQAAAAYKSTLGVYDDHEITETNYMREDSWKNMEEKVRPAIESIEKEFREILLSCLEPVNQ